MTREEKDNIYGKLLNDRNEKRSITDYAAYLELNNIEHIPNDDINDLYILLWAHLDDTINGIEYNLEKLIESMIQYKYNSESEYDVIMNIILVMRFTNYLYDNAFVQRIHTEYGHGRSYIWDSVSHLFTDENIQKIYDDVVYNIRHLRDSVPKKHFIELDEFVNDTRIYIMWFLYANAPTKFAHNITDLIHDIPTVLM